MSTVINYKAPPTVGDFMLSDAKLRFIMGPWGSGKTTGCVMELARRMMEEHPDSQGVRDTRMVVVRNTSQQLRQTVLKDIEKWLSGAMHFKITDSTVQLRCTHPQLGKIKSDWMLIPLDEPRDVQRLLSLNITGGWVSEFREIPIEVVTSLFGRTGRYLPIGIKKPAWRGVIGESNPPDEDSEWHNRLEVERPDNWAVFKQPGGMDPAAENRENLPEGYYEDLLATNTADWSDVHVHAKYGKSLSGQAVFRTSFNPEFHLAKGELRPIPGMPLMLGQDFGRTPTALIGQVDNRGRLLVLREANSMGMGLEQFLITNLRPMLTQYYAGFSAFMVADPTGRDKGQITEESPFDALRRMGFRVYGAPTNEVEGRLRAVEQLFLRQADGGPAIIISEEGCPLLVKALKFHYRYKRKQSGELEDKPDKTHPWSDLADCLQYMALGYHGNYTAQLIAESRPRNRKPSPSVAGWT